MIYFEIRNKEGRILASNLDSCPVLDYFLGNEGENLAQKDARNVIRNNISGEVRLIIHDDKELLNSSKGMARLASVYLSLIPQFEVIEQRQRQHFDLIIDRFAHNLVDINRKIKSHLERLASDNLREENFQEFKEKVEERIKNNTSSAANDICQIAHRATDLEAQIAGLRVISGLAEKIAPSLIDVNVLRAARRLIQPFLNELEKKEIKIELKINPEQAKLYKVRIDPQLFNVAMSQLFNNFGKYVLPKSDVCINAEFNDKECILNISMISVFIEPSEINKIFQEKFKGEHAKKMPGNGIGLFLAKRALRIMKGDIEVQVVNQEVSFLKSVKYGKNIFLIKLPRKNAEKL
jgi:light-regulated signal transduction histidine kinase (bacteriophytochrome)